MIESIERLIEEAVKLEISKSACSVAKTAPFNQAAAESQMPSIPVGISARHVHLSRADLNVLYGDGYELRPKKDLMGGEFAAEERLTLIGTNLRVIENVRILGPERQQTQVEISRTDARKLGINPPVRESGDLAQSHPITIVGPAGAIRLQEGCIIAMRHIHMNEEDAHKLGVSDREIVSVSLGDETRQGILDQVLVRVKKNYKLEMHIDTDEANGLGVGPKDFVKIKK